MIEDLRYQAHYDALTGLPNKTSFVEPIQRSLHLCPREQQEFAVLFIDLDRFKWINDSLGHSCGDQALQEAAERLSNAVSKEVHCLSQTTQNNVSRFGGDEFIILLESIANRAEAERIASEIVEVMRQPFHIAGRTLHLSASVGVVHCDGQYSSAEDVIRDADIAMYEVKDAGRGRYRMFDAPLIDRPGRP